MIRTISDAVKFLEYYVPTSEKKHPGELGLLRMRELITYLDNPQLRYPTIHVGGTSGKGSTATIIASILATKFRVGLHTSPHLVRINERITYYACLPARQVSRITKTISDEEFIALVNEIRPYIEQMEKGKYGAPSYFEIVTAMAFLYFAKKKVEIAVIEVGMGGRFDATNVINPLVAVLTNVGLDHTEILGETVEEIARDKVGIIKPGMRVVSGVSQPTVVDIVEKACAKAGVSLSLAGRDFDTVATSVTGQGSVFDYSNGKKYFDLKLLLLGEHQVDNAALAIKTMELIGDKKQVISNNVISDKRYVTSINVSPVTYHVSPDDIRFGLRSAYIPGRLEIVQRNPTVILDGAHNPDKMKALVEAVKDIWEGKKVTVIIAIKEDKNAKIMLEILLPICSKIILTQYKVKMDQGEIVSHPPAKLGEIIKRINQNKLFKAIRSPQHALQQAIQNADKHEVILVTGSLYLVGITKNIWMELVQ